MIRLKSPWVWPHSGLWPGCNLHGYAYVKVGELYLWKFFFFSPLQTHPKKTEWKPKWNKQDPKCPERKMVEEWHVLDLSTPSCGQARGRTIFGSGTVPLHLWTPRPGPGFCWEHLLNATFSFSSGLSVSSWGGGGNSQADNYIADVGFSEENWGKLWGLPSCDETPQCLPAGPIILQTATIKNDLQLLANFSMLLDSLESYLTLKKNTDGQTCLLSKWHRIRWLLLRKLKSTAPSTSLFPPKYLLVYLFSFFLS